MRGVLVLQPGREFGRHFDAQLLEGDKTAEKAAAGAMWHEPVAR